jgi:hypothetical protein
MVRARVPPESAVRARGRVDKWGGRYLLTLEIATASTRGERALEASTCGALASSAAVVIAMSVAPAAREVAPSPEASSSSVAPSPEGSSPAPSPEAREVAPSPEASSPPGPARPMESSAGSSRGAADRPGAGAPPPTAEPPRRFQVRAHVVGDAGGLPAPALGGGLAFGASLAASLSVEASANLFASQEHTAFESPARGASFALLAVGARACWTLTRPVELAPCLGVELERIAASGFGSSTVGRAESITWAPEALVAVRLPLVGLFALRAGIGVVAPISRQSFVIQSAGAVHQPGVVALRTWAGPEVRF